jgi:hypothetical protein
MLIFHFVVLFVFPLLQYTSYTLILQISVSIGFPPYFGSFLDDEIQVLYYSTLFFQKKILILFLTFSLCLVLSIFFPSSSFLSICFFFKHGFDTFPLPLLIFAHFMHYPHYCHNGNENRDSLDHTNKWNKRRLKVDLSAIVVPKY